LWFGLPWGMDRVDRVPVDRVRRVTVGHSPEEEETDSGTPPGQLLPGDHNLVNVQVVIHYSVDDDTVVSFIEHEDRVDGLIARTADTILAAWVAGRGIDDVLLQGKVRLPEVLVSELRERLAPYQLGVEVQAVD